MPLSEDEQRKLDEIERALFDEDPVFSRTITMNRLWRQRMQATVAYFCVGMVMLVAGVVLTPGPVPVGVLISGAGFLIMVWGVALFFRRRRGR